MKNTTPYMHTYSRNDAPTPESDPASISDPENLNHEELRPKPGDNGDRLITICEPITPVVAMRVTTELLSYEASRPGVPIHMQLFSPGGCVVSGLAIIDTMSHITSPVFTYSIGYAASMAAVILACGEKDHRYILPHSRVMIHQASGSAGGTLENVRATLAYQNELENDCDEILSTVTGRDIAVIREASRVDNWMRAEAAKNFGLVDHVLESSILSNQRHSLRN
jgi:ATP-dependent Clp protease protease subunit